MNKNPISALLISIVLISTLLAACQKSLDPSSVPALEETFEAETEEANKPNMTPSPTLEPTATPTETPVPTETPTPTNTPTPKPTNTPLPTSTPKPTPVWDPPMLPKGFELGWDTVTFTNEELVEAYRGAFLAPILLEMVKSSEWDGRIPIINYYPYPALSQGDQADYMDHLCNNVDYATLCNFTSRYWYEYGWGYDDRREVWDYLVFYLGNSSRAIYCAQFDKYSPWYTDTTSLWERE